jgi:hypothetical protein
MNFHRSQTLAVTTRWLCAVLVVVVLGGNVQAQPAEGGRWLLVFDTSTTMKKRLPATAEALQRFVATSAEGHIQSGDSVAVWTYARQLAAGQFPLVEWQPVKAGAFGSNLVSFLRSQRYTNDSTFAPLLVPLGQVISSSERLTIVIFCDGLSSISFTPYDEGINQNFTDGQAERKKSQQPFAVVLRTQLGKFVGCTVGFPPGNINIPPFPPLPPPPPSVAASAPSAPVAAPKAVVPDLVIVGKKVGTNDDVAVEAAVPLAQVVVPPTPNPAVAAPDPSVVPAVVAPPLKVVPTLVPPPPVRVTPPPPTNALVAARPLVAHPVVTPVSPVVTQAVPVLGAAPLTTNAMAVAAPVAGESHTRMFVFIGVGLLVVAIVVVLAILRVGRRHHASLITSTMNDDPRRK